MDNKEIISEKTLTMWIMFWVLSATVFILAASFYLYLTYDCWPLSSIRPGRVHCFSEVLPSYLYLLPAIFGSVTGTFLTKLYIKKSGAPSAK